MFHYGAYPKGIASYFDLDTIRSTAPNEEEPPAAPAHPPKTAPARY